MKSGQIAECPSAPPAPIAMNAPPVAYGYNAHYLSSELAGGLGGVGGGVNTAIIEAPTETVLMADGASWRSTGWGRPGYVFAPSARNSRVHARHLSTANVLWVDGHVKAMKISHPTSSADEKTRELGTLSHPNFPYAGDNPITSTAPGCPGLAPGDAAAASNAVCRADYYFMLIKPTP
jgi:prepilin-type processing-associated H-X9-DG protein